MGVYVYVVCKGTDRARGGCVPSWQRARTKLQRIVNISSKIIGFKQSSLTVLYEKQVLRKANKIINDNTHILHNEYVLLPSSRRFRTIVSKTTRKRHSFIPMYVRLLNDKHL